MISTIIPSYNERENIKLIIEKIIKLLHREVFEIIIVDDNSPDKTAQIVKTNFVNNDKVKLFVRKNEKGLGTAIVYGINKSRGDVIISMDADLNHPPELIPILLENIKNNDLVIASRFIKDGGMEDKLRYYFTYIFNLFLKHILGFPTMDNMSGFYAIRREALFKLPLTKIYQGYGEYHLRLVWNAKNMGLTIKEIPVYYPKRKFGKSKSNLLKMFFNYLYCAIKLYAGFEK